MKESFGDSGGRLLPIDRLFLAYLGFSWVMIGLFMPLGVPKLGRLGVYPLVASLIVWIAHSSPHRNRVIRFFREWYPLALLLPLYGEIAIMSRLLTDRWYDAVVIAAENRVFGGQPSMYLSDMFPQIWLSEWMHFSYFSYVFLVPVITISLFALGRVREFRASLFLIFLTFFGCYVVFAFFPIEAPNFIYPKIQGPRAEYPSYWLVHHWMQSNVTKGCGLPSPHVAVAATAAWCAYRYLRPLFPIYALIAVSIAIATVYCRLHYALDAIAGLVWAFGACVLGARVLRPEIEARSRGQFGALTESESGGHASERSQDQVQDQTCIDHPQTAKMAKPPRLRVAIVCDGVGKVVGGAFISARRFGEQLNKRGHNVVFFSSRSWKEPESGEVSGITTHVFPGVRIPRLDRQLYLAVPLSKRLRRLLSTGGFDIVHVMVPTPLGLAAARVARSNGIPVVMHSHTQPENIIMNAPAFARRDALRRPFYDYLTWIYRHSDVMIHPSAFAARQFPELSALRHVVISNGVDRQRFRPSSPEEFLRRFNVPGASPRLMYLGRLHREKNVETLIKAMPHLMRRHPRAHLFIVGFGYQQPDLERLARDCDVAAHITFCGYVPDEQLVAAYNACDLFVMPSLAELEGMAVLEAMSCGCPILIADSADSAATDFVQDNGFLFRALDHEHLAWQAHRLVSDLEVSRAMATNSLGTSRKFDIAQSAQALEAVYYSCVRDRG